MDDVAPPRRDRDGDEIPDDRLRLICTCCHPALAPEAQVALTLRLLCGLSTAEVARAFLVSEPTMAARITRAKKKIAAARIPYRVPPARAAGPHHRRRSRSCTCCSRPGTRRRPARRWCAATSSSGRSTWPACCARCCRTRPTSRACSPCCCSPTPAAQPALDPDGRLLLLAEQDRSRWDRAAIAEGVELVRQALRRGRRAGTRCRPRSPPSTPRRRAGSDRLGRGRRAVRRAGEIWPSPVVALNRAVAVGFAGGPEAGLAALDALGARAAAGRLRLPGRGPGRLPAPPRPRRRGPHGLRRGAAPDHQRGRARVPAATAGATLNA